jgi:CHAT domain-containing protein
VELIAPVRAQIAPFETLVFIPDRQLYAVPFAALYDERNAHHLIEDFTIRIARSSSAAASEATGALSPALVIADPPTAKWRRLAASREEAQRVAAIYGATLLSGEEATRARFTDAAAQSALIHFSGHADSDARESWGALLLAAGDGDSGILGTSDLARLQLAAHPLVVLAACGTFRGDPVHLSGMSSLARAFLIAGARGVVGTLWEIEDDVAGPLFLRFHQSLRAGASPARALRDAQLQMLHSADPRLSHPATWSAVAFSS